MRFQVNPDATTRAGFTAEELGTVGVAMVEGEPAVGERGLLAERDHRLDDAAQFFFDLFPYRAIALLFG